MYKKILYLEHPVREINCPSSHAKVLVNNIDDGKKEEPEPLSAKNMALYEEELLLRSQAYVQKREEVLKLEEINSMLKQISKSVNNHMDVKLHLITQFKEQVVTISLAVAKKIIAQELQMDPEIIVNTMKKALESLESEKNIEIELHPDDKILIETNNNMKTFFPNSDQSWQLIGNNVISRGGCKIRSVSGIIDATLESQLEYIESLLTESFDNHAN